MTSTNPNSRETLKASGLTIEVKGWTFHAQAKPEPEGSGESIELRLRYKDRNVLEDFIEAQTSGALGILDFIRKVAGEEDYEAVLRFYSNEQFALTEAYMEEFSRRTLALPEDFQGPKEPSPS